MNPVSHRAGTEIFCNVYDRTTRSLGFQTDQEETKIVCEELMVSMFIHISRKLAAQKY